MQLCTVQWNIGGAHIRTPDGDALSAASYVNENLAYIIEKLKAYGPDIITLQETHANGNGSQAEIIAKELGLQYVVNDSYDNSHIDTTQKLSQSIISRFPITDHSFSLFFNPPYRKVMEDGSDWVSHDKGLSTAVLNVEGKDLIVQTLHLIPFRKFEADMEDETGKKVRSSIESLIEKTRTPYLLQGDFNHPDIRTLLPGIFIQELHELGGKEGTTPKGRIYDHVLYRGIKQNAEPLVDNQVLTDHHPIVCRFEG